MSSPIKDRPAGSTPASPPVAPPWTPPAPPAQLVPTDSNPVTRRYQQAEKGAL